MCGILACISRNGAKIDEGILSKARMKMLHRGPDASGEVVRDWVGIAHNRLSIIDLSHAADQPMFSQDERYAIVYNGEIYNYKELRKELAASGVDFKTKSDTEVLLNMYIRFSSGCLSRLRGMFAFVIVDYFKKEVFAARDHFGIKPLYMCKTRDHIILSSEIKPIAEFIPLEPNYATYFEQIYFRYTLGRDMCFKGIQKLLPGCYIKYKRQDDELAERPYYDLSATFEENKGLKGQDEREIIDQVEEILAVRIQVDTYSEVGCNLALSWGVASTPGRRILG